MRERDPSERVVRGRVVSYTGIVTREEVEPTIKRIIAKYIDPEEFYVFLFGSRAMGQVRPSSDYDIGLYGGRKVPLSVIAKMKDELEEYPIPVDIDFVDFASVSDEFKRLALKEIKVWNKPRKNLRLT